MRKDDVIMSPEKFAIKTLGCKVNQYETQLLIEKFLLRGYKLVPLKQADVIVINSCTVTSEADRKTVQAVRKLKREDPSRCVLVTGCYAVTAEDIIRLRDIPEIDIIVPGGKKMCLPDILEGKRSETNFSEYDAFPGRISSFSGHTRAFVKVQDGCDRRCSYCKINIVRGPSVSRAYGDILAEIGHLVSGGFKEIVLTGICIGSWKGKDLFSISDLVKGVESIPGNFRFRLSSIEPDQIDKRLIGELSASRKFCRHFHIPLQSGSDTVLRSMKRRYTSGNFIEIVSEIRKNIPVCGISLDVMTGFPGEKTTDFEQTRKLIHQIAPSRLHVFSYSDRPGTDACSKVNKVPEQAIKERTKRLIEDGIIHRDNFSKSFIGKTIEVLNEKSPKVPEGYTREYVRVKLLKAANVPKGAFFYAQGKGVETGSGILVSTPI